MRETGFNPVQGKRRRHERRMVLLVLLLLGTMVFALGVGSVSIPRSEVMHVLLQGFGIDTGHEVLPKYEVIVWQVRLPRVFLAVVVGMALASAGAAFQGLFRNPMADPFVIGVSSGAAVGASLALFLSLSFSFMGLSSLTILGFIGALLTVLFVYNLARVDGYVAVSTLLLAGIATGSFLSAVVSLLIYFSRGVGDRMAAIVFWLMGGLGGANWSQVLSITPWVILGILVLVYYARDLNAMVLGEETAYNLGINVERTKKIILFTGSLLTAAAVSLTGIIGFVGLIVPHIVRLVIGADHRFLIPTSAIVGGLFLLLADTLARTILSPSEIPVGIITAFFGAPFFLFLLKKRKNQVLGGW